MSNKDLNIIKQFDSDSKEEFKRPHHKDFMTSGELKNISYTGIRFNSISDSIEIWVEGTVKGSMDAYTAKEYPDKFDKLFADVFELHEVDQAKVRGN